LAKRDEITSTEKLLDLIREPKEHPRPQAEASATATAKPTAAGNGPAKVQGRRLALKRRVVVGVEIGYTDLKMATVHRQAEKRFELADYRSIPLPEGLVPHENGFDAFLKRALNDYCGSPDRVHVWSVISSARVETRCVRIPKLPRKQVANAVYWTFTKEVRFNREEELIDFEVLEDVLDAGVQKTEVMTYTAPREEVEQMTATFRQAGYPLKGLSIVPFAVQNLLRMGILPNQGRDICNLFIGRDWSRIAIYSNGNLILARGIKAGMRSMVEGVQQGIAAGDIPADLIAAIPTAGEKPALPLGAMDNAQQAQAQQLLSAYVQGHLEEHLPASGAADRILILIQPALERLLRQVERTFQHYTLHFSGNGLERIFLSGPMTGCKPIGDYLRRQLDLPIESLNPFPEGSNLVRTIAIPKTAVDREAYVPAVGMALSHNALTPNFLFTHKDKEKRASIDRVNRLVFTICMTVLLVFSAWYLWQGQRLSVAEDEVAGLRSRLTSYSPQADKQMVLKLIGHARKQNQEFIQLGSVYKPVALINEINEITPANIRLIALDVILATAAEEKGGLVDIEGVVFGDRSSFEPSLTGFMLQFRASPLFKKQVIINKSFQFYNNQEVLRFTARLEPF
jgi:type IV pilus assembly protein PilM